MKYCSVCGTSVSLIVPTGDNRERFVCDNQHCGTIHYQNPRIITGCLPTYGDSVLLCKRAIEPKYGLWTLPAGFMENGESTEQGAIRESWEEARAKCAIDKLYGVYSLPHINQVYFIYKATLEKREFNAGEESLDVKLFTEADIPWKNIAFSVMSVALNQYFTDSNKQQLNFHSGTINATGQFSLTGG